MAENIRDHDQCDSEKMLQKQGNWTGGCDRRDIDVAGGAQWPQDQCLLLHMSALYCERVKFLGDLPLEEYCPVPYGLPA